MVIFVTFVLLYIFIIVYEFVDKYFMISELNLIERYGHNSWACITGCSSGQGKQFALQLAKRGFNIILLGRERIKEVEEIINENYKGVETVCIVKDFSKSFEDDFFDDIEKVITEKDVSILVNNVGYRTAWKPYYKMPLKLIKDTIAVGTIVQCRLIQIVLPKFLKRKHEFKKSIIINMTAQCMHPNIGFNIENEITVPYMSVYEASNAFGFYHSNSVYKEFKDDIDYLTITPGAVVTENTMYLKNTIFSIDAETYVENVIRFMGNVNGTHCAYWGHELSSILINFSPSLKNDILQKVGENICKNIQNKLI